jgi:hypothetical protein
MRYFLITFLQKSDGRIDETTAVSRNLKTRDLQTCNVILDFKKLQVVKAHMNGVTVPKDFNKIVEYYIQHYENIIDRLFAENGYERVKAEPAVTE